MMLTSNHVLLVEQAPQNDCCWSLCPQGKSHLPPDCLGGSPKSASASDPGLFITTATELGLRVCEILHIILFSIPLCLNHKQSSSSWKPEFFGSFFWCRTLGLETLMWGLSSLILGENICNYNSPPLCGSTPLWVSLPLLLVLWFLFLWKIFPSSLQVLLIDSCTVSSCNFCLPVGRAQGLFTPSSWLYPPYFFLFDNKF